MANNPENYKVHVDVLGIVWAALFESGHDELARVVAKTMIAQGCQELTGVTDSSLVLMFNKQYIEKEGNTILQVVATNKELH
jgi:hypothetical protein|tara:strand:+ start:1282 stop:1527 length:246 start_codon:yes stop_codon:yes gene_type:complete